MQSHCERLLYKGSDLPELTFFSQLPPCLVVHFVQALPGLFIRVQLAGHVALCGLYTAEKHRCVLACRSVVCFIEELGS